MRHIFVLLVVGGVLACVAGVGVKAFGEHFSADIVECDVWPSTSTSSQGVRGECAVLATCGPTECMQTFYDIFTNLTAYAGTTMLGFAHFVRA